VCAESSHEYSFLFSPSSKIKNSGQNENGIYEMKIDSVESTKDTGRYKAIDDNIEGSYYSGKGK
jgi:hypothetical protein